ncbi:hypothetical protein ACFU3J_00735 [Streptomyces sp. NPDC057411]|uniref:hypothetical protein n=1 Tax=unclassified Streptomyces TaxID=2593676 RepID=UPI00363B7BDA
MTAGSRRPRPLIAGVGVAALASALLATSPARADDASVKLDLSKAYKATAKYAYEPFAIRDGFLRTDVCVADPGMGGMGYHYVKPQNVGSTDPARPAVVIYATGKDGKRHLVAVEWVVPNTGQPVPRMFDRNFDGPFANPVLGNIYDRHVWLYKKNPAGLFARYNPDVKCP